MAVWGLCLRPNQLRCHGCGQLHPQARLITLPDGREVGSYSEEYRRYTEAAWVLKNLPDKHRDPSRMTKFRYLQAIERRRGRQARDELREEMLRIHYHAKRTSKP